MEQLAPLLPGSRLQFAGKRAPRFGVPVETFGYRCRVAQQKALVVGELRRVDFAVEHLEPGAEVGQPLEIGPQQKPVLLGDIGWQVVGHSREVELVQQPRVQQLDVVRIEMRGRSAEVREVEIAGQLVEIGDRLDRLRRADPREERQHRHRLDAFLAQMLGAV